MNFKKLRKDFPSLKNKGVIYFDNACQSLRPRQVINSVLEYYEKYPACAGRGVYKWARQLEQRIWDARVAIQKFIGAKYAEEIIFTRNTTEGINLVAHCLHPNLVITSSKEHNSNLVPWQMLGCEHQIMSFEKLAGLDRRSKLEKILKKSSAKTKLVSIVYTSNLDGSSLPVEEIIKVARDNGALVLLDAAQAVPHRRVDVAKLDCDFLVFSGHKMLGPSGMGVLYGKKKILEKMPGFITGGGMLRGATYKSHEFLPLPNKFEGGLQNYAGILGLGTAIKYLDKIIHKIPEHGLELNKYATRELLKLSVKILGPEDPKFRSSIISFHSDKISSHEIALQLDKRANIAVRSGRFCVNSWFKANKIRDAARISFYFYNSLEEVKVLTETLKKILK